MRICNGGAWLVGMELYGLHVFVCIFGRYIEQRIGMYMHDLSFDYLPYTSVQKYCSWKNSQVPRPLFSTMGNQAP